MKRYYFLDSSKLAAFLSTLSHYGKIWGFDEYGNLAQFKEDDFSRFRFRSFRGVDSLKPIIFSPFKLVAEYPGGKDKRIEISPMVLLDIKPCDLNALKVFDEVFIEDKEFVDPFMKSIRENLLIISSDCTSVGEYCFCNLVGGSGFATDGYDILISPVDGGYVVDAATEKGEGVLEGFSLPEADENELEEIRRRRKVIQRKLEEKNAGFVTTREYYELVRENYNSRAWVEQAPQCVACGACTNICPTCYCFGLQDHDLKAKYARTMNWDSCQFAGFSRMAGMLNPRVFHRQHFEHRYDHKFHHFKERYNFYACTGCGRCIEVCLGKIDMRKVLKRVDELAR